MRQCDAELIIPYLHLLKGRIYEPTGLKVKKFLIVPYGDEDVSIFIQSYSIHQWNETGLLGRLFKENNNFKIIAQYDLDYPNFNYVSVSEFNKDLLWEIVIDGVKSKYHAQGLIDNDDLNNYFELKTEPLSLNFLDSKPLPTKVRNEIIALSSLIYQIL